MARIDWKDVAFTEPPLDLTGRPILVGDIIAYPYQVGRSSLMKFGKVTQIRLTKGKIPGWNPDYEWRIHVVGVTKSCWNSKEKPTLNNAGTLYFPERMVVLSRHMIKNAAVLELLDSIETKG